MGRSTREISPLRSLAFALIESSSPRQNDELLVFAPPYEEEKRKANGTMEDRPLVGLMVMRVLGQCQYPARIFQGCAASTLQACHLIMWIPTGDQLLRGISKRLDAISFGQHTSAVITRDPDVRRGDDRRAGCPTLPVWEGSRVEVPFPLSWRVIGGTSRQHRFPPQPDVIAAEMTRLITYLAWWWAGPTIRKHTTE